LEQERDHFRECRQEQKRRQERQGRRVTGVRALRTALRSWRISSLLLLLLAAPCFADQIDDLLTTGKKAFGDGQYSLAVKSFQRITEEFPEASKAEEAEYLLGVSLFHAGNWANALDVFAGFRERRPGSGLLSRASYWTGAADIKLGRFEKALEALSGPAGRPPGSDPYRSYSLLLMGVALEALGKEPEAGASYRAVLSDPGAVSLAPEASYRLAGVEYRARRDPPGGER
jgi:TolA-binding protein